MSKFIEGFKHWWTGKYPNTCPRVGGQAVMEGVMMQGPACTAIAVRKSDGTIALKTKPTVRPSDRRKWYGIPLVRGVASFIMMMYVGVKTLMESADMAGLDQEEPSKFEKKVAEKLHVKPDDVMMTFAVILALLLAIGLFYVLPISIEWLLRQWITSDLAVNLIGGVVRIIVFLLYVYLCSRLKEIKRVFQYHGAEHKSIFCFEHGQALTVENARQYTTLHPRCGTSFLVIVMVISILLFTIAGEIVGSSINENIFLRILSRLILLPLVAGISYEVLQALGRAEDTRLVRALKWPGLMVQKITTAEPDDSMLEVALVSLKAALGDEHPLPESYYETVDAPTDPVVEAPAAEDAADE